MPREDARALSAADRDMLGVRSNTAHDSQAVRVLEPEEEADCRPPCSAPSATMDLGLSAAPSPEMTARHAAAWRSSDAPARKARGRAVRLSDDAPSVDVPFLPDCENAARSGSVKRHDPRICRDQAKSGLLAPEWKRDGHAGGKRPLPRRTVKLSARRLAPTCGHTTASTSALFRPKEAERPIVAALRRRHAAMLGAVARRSLHRRIARAAHFCNIAGNAPESLPTKAVLYPVRPFSRLGL